MIGLLIFLFVLAVLGGASYAAFTIREQRTELNKFAARNRELVEEIAKRNYAIEQAKAIEIELEAETQKHARLRKGHEEAQLSYSRNCQRFISEIKGRDVSIAKLKAQIKALKAKAKKPPVKKK